MYAEFVSFHVGDKGCPVQLGGVYPGFLNGVFLGQLFQEAPFRGNKVDSVDDFENAELVESKDNVFGHDGRLFGNVHDAHAARVVEKQKVHNGGHPIGFVGLLTKVGHGFFRRTHLFFLFAELVRKGNQETTVSLSLMGGEGKDTSQIVSHVRVLLLAVVPHRMKAPIVHLAQDVKEKGINIKVECLVIQKEFGNITQVLTIDAFLVPVDFKH